MLIAELESEGFKLKAGCNKPASVRGVRKYLVLSRGDYKYISWSFDNINFTVPMIIPKELSELCAISV